MTSPLGGARSIQLSYRGMREGMYEHIEMQGTRKPDGTLAQNTLQPRTSLCDGLRALRVERRAIGDSAFKEAIPSPSPSALVAKLLVETEQRRTPMERTAAGSARGLRFWVGKSANPSVLGLQDAATALRGFRKVAQWRARPGANVRTVSAAAAVRARRTGRMRGAPRVRAG